MPKRQTLPKSFHKQTRRPSIQAKQTSQKEMQAAIKHFGSVRKAAKALNISKSTLHDYIKGKTEPKRKTLADINRGVTKLPLKERKKIEKEMRSSERKRKAFNKEIELIRKRQGSAGVLRRLNEDDEENESDY
jgi:transcriptional regulator with XRE-family HTH domain